MTAAVDTIPTEQKTRVTLFACLNAELTFDQILPRVTCRIFRDVSRAVLGQSDGPTPDAGAVDNDT
jgi:hypothetical protein